MSKTNGFLDIPQTQLIAAVRQVFRNELDAIARVDGKGSREWIRDEVKQAVQGAGIDRPDIIRSVVVEEINRILGGSYSRTKLSAMIDTIIREEVKAILAKSLTINVTGSIAADVDPTKYEREAKF